QRKYERNKKGVLITVTFSAKQRERRVHPNLPDAYSLIGLGSYVFTQAWKCNVIPKHTSAHTHTHTYTHTHTHTHTPPHTHTYTHSVRVIHPPTERHTDSYTHPQSGVLVHSI